MIYLLTFSLCCVVLLQGGATAIPNEGCPNGWIKRGNFCYKFSNTKQNSITAEKTCSSEGAHISSVENADEGKFLNKLAGRDLLIGFTDREKEGTFKWTDGSTSTYINWAPHQPDNSYDEDCAHLRTDGTFNDIDCKTYITVFVCKKPIQCPKGWIKRNNFCYKFPNKKQNYITADKTCSSEGAHISSVENADEAKFLNKLAGKQQIFIGFTDQDKEGTFKWADGSTSTYTNWAPGEPNNSGKTGEDCGTLRKDLIWNDINCKDHKRLFVCKKKLA